MRAEELKALRKAIKGLTQAAAAGAIGISTVYYGELERGDKPIDIRLAQRITEALRPRIEVSFSEALNGWFVVSVVPQARSSGKPEYRMEVLAQHDEQVKAQIHAERLVAERWPSGKVVLHRRVLPPTTTNPRGV